MERLLGAICGGLSGVCSNRGAVQAQTEDAHVCYEANQWISQLFVKGKEGIDPMTGEEVVRFLTDLRSLNDAIAYPGHWNQEMSIIADIKANVPQWTEYYAKEDVSNTFEGMITVEGQERLLAVAPPVRLNADSFIDEGRGGTRTEAVR